MESGTKPIRMPPIAITAVGASKFRMFSIAAAQRTVALAAGQSTMNTSRNGELSAPLRNSQAQAKPTSP